MDCTGSYRYTYTCYIRFAVLRPVVLDIKRVGG